ncbi:MAG TPA: hypothetical protein VKR83_09435 [Ktedonobacteraceae bacterium]|nr:hypothetical protein [Ktedonobacteraceae bacterium]
MMGDAVHYSKKIASIIEWIIARATLAVALEAKHSPPRTCKRVILLLVTLVPALEAAAIIQLD